MRHLRNPSDVLNSLQSKATNPQYLYQRIYRNLFNPRFYLQALQNLYGNHARMDIEPLSHIIACMRDHSFQPVWIDRSSKRREDPSAIETMLVQEIVRMLLQSIFEPTFVCRPRQSRSTVLRQIRQSYADARWLAAGSVEGQLSAMDQHVLMGILRRRIDDEHFIALLWKLLRTGALENGTREDACVGGTQAAGLSSLLWNIYLNEMDAFLFRYEKELCLQGRSTPSNIAPLPKADAPVCPPQRILYCRYAHAFLLGVVGGKGETEQICRDVRAFLTEHLHFSPSTVQMSIAPAEKGVCFRGYAISVCRRRNPTPHRDGLPHLPNAVVQLRVPKEMAKQQLLSHGSMVIRSDGNGKERWKPIARKRWIHQSPATILSAFTREMEDFSRQYALADNRETCRQYQYLMRRSMYRTLARKYRCSSTKVIRQYRKKGILCFQSAL